jgi:hypothetical protein
VDLEKEVSSQKFYEKISLGVKNNLGTISQKYKSNLLFF